MYLILFFKKPILLIRLQETNCYQRKVTAAKKVITVSGKVTDNKKEPLPGVTVVLVGTNKGIYTDIKGEFSIDVPVENYSSLNLRMIGMNDVTINWTKELTTM